MKNYEEVTKSVMERSKEIIAKKSIRHRRIIKAFSTSATCLVLVGALGLCAWISSHRGSDIVLSSDGDLPPLAVDDVITAFTGIVGISQSATAKYTDDGFDSTDFGEPVEDVSENSYSHNPGDTIATNTAPVETRPWYVSPGIDTCDWDESTQPYSCNHHIIDSYKTDITNSDIPPQNGTIYISAEVKEALDYFGKTYSDGCEASYYVYMIYYKDGKRIIASEELYKSELARLNDFVYDFKGNGISGMYNFLGLEMHEYNCGEHCAYNINAALSKSQLENISPCEDYGIAIYLVGNYCDAQNKQHNSSHHSHHNGEHH